jgi:hypothetical protein
LTGQLTSAAWRMGSRQSARILTGLNFSAF